MEPTSTPTTTYLTFADDGGWMTLTYRGDDYIEGSTLGGDDAQALIDAGAVEVTGGEFDSLGPDVEVAYRI
jgi:hypothetical protein